MTKPQVRSIHPISAEHFRLLEAETLYTKMQVLQSEKFKKPMSLKQTLDCIHSETKENDVILICGSFFIMADVREALGIPQEVDPPMINK